MAKRGTYSTGYTYTTGMVDQFASDPNAYDLYCTLVPGDACFYRYYDYAQGRMRGHAILFTGVNLSTKSVTYIEQIDGDLVVKNNSSWTSGTKTFQQLKNSNYVPIRPTDI